MAPIIYRQFRTAVQKREVKNMVFTKEWLKNCAEEEKKPCTTCGKPSTRLAFNPNGIPFAKCDDCVPPWDCANKPIRQVFSDLPEDW
jgi:hypothetical protein